MLQMQNTGMHLTEHDLTVNMDSHTHRPAPALARGACSPLARLLAGRPESHRGEAGLTAASDARWQSLVERNKYTTSNMQE